MTRREAVTHVAWILGGVFSAPTIQAMNRWQEMSLSPNAVHQTGAFLTETQHEIMARVADLIIPRTDTPGAVDAGVPDFMEVMLRDCYKKPAQDAFLMGVDGLEKKGFLKLSPGEQTATLRQIEADAPKDGSPSFWLITKELTLLVYYTSEAGIKASFDYQPIPGRFEAIKIKPGQKDFMYGNQA
ncbi:gluconate 2-dehydrogenase subunit 3 family protein [Spirosoma sp. KUDC1026]|uniref:gluconate 2-dehydrogenase subunit 3 family protein n=1 Tax=Spirosoma sp. KUDC1026 TaxID=2745947 RepID=UPI00159BA4D6|nr:gluconate 2-dehydrogenase subunit 3 family protein [Spirosoma sp. KUDC1026]QKZ14295.1 gluconate 2-dehydrogenase subunit 3 family protein [Spirosoma sp. KUDC1026]